MEACQLFSPTARPRPASDALFTEKRGQAISALNIASVDLHSDTIVLTRNTPGRSSSGAARKQIALDSKVSRWASRDGRPVISEIHIEAGLTIAICADGLIHSGQRRGQPMDLCQFIDSLRDEQDPSPQDFAEALLAYAVRLDHGRPADDISVLVLKVVPVASEKFVA